MGYGIGLRGVDGDALELAGLCEIRAGEAPRLPAYLLPLDLGLVLVTSRALVVLAVLQVVLGSCSGVVLELGYVGLVVDAHHKERHL